MTKCVASIKGLPAALALKCTLRGQSMHASMNVYVTCMHTDKRFRDILHKDASNMCLQMHAYVRLLTLKQQSLPLRSRTIPSSNFMHSKARSMLFIDHWHVQACNCDEQRHDHAHPNAAVPTASKLIFPSSFDTYMHAYAQCEHFDALDQAAQDVSLGMHASARW